MQSVYNIAEICYLHGIRNAVLCPGSRCAPLTLAFVKHPEIKTITISDERSAAFIAVGIALQTKKPVALICTSGSALFNFAPAVAEAFYRNISILLLTADRPPEWIDQADGQTIRQQGIYGKHVKADYSLQADLSHPDAKWETERIISEAINMTQDFPCGPVQVNVPLREPLYPATGEEISFAKEVKVIRKMKGGYALEKEEWDELIEEYNKAGKKLIVAGQSLPDPSLVKIIEEFSGKNSVSVVSDTISNFQGIAGSVKHHDIILSTQDTQVKVNLRPDLLITFGGAVISKCLKQFIRKYKPSAHWHIQPAGYTPDTFQSLTRIVPVDTKYFFSTLNEINKKLNSVTGYFDAWQQAESRAKATLEKFLTEKSSFSEFHAAAAIMNSLPEGSILHLANSMPVRYANYLSLYGKNVDVHANRGTSGIDGVISTAYGMAMHTDKIVTVLTGDMAFFYDRNSFWNNYLPENLRIIILNNHGGGIFRLLPGPSSRPELEEYFETKQPLTAKHLAQEFGLEYLHSDNQENLEDCLKGFFSKGKVKILEVETRKEDNEEVFRRFKEIIELTVDN